MKPGTEVKVKKWTLYAFYGEFVPVQVYKTGRKDMPSEIHYSIIGDGQPSRELVKALKKAGHKTERPESVRNPMINGRQCTVTTSASSEEAVKISKQVFGEKYVKMLDMTLTQKACQIADHFWAVDQAKRDTLGTFAPN